MQQPVRNIDWDTAAKMLNVGPIVLRRKLVEREIFTKGKPCLPKPQYIHMGYFDTELTTFKRGPVEQWTTKALVTAKGIAFLREFLDTHDLEQTQPVLPGKPGTPARQAVPDRQDKGPGRGEDARRACLRLVEAERE